MANKTTQTPAEHAQAVQGMKLWDSLHVYEKTAPSTSDILAGRVIREPSSVEEVVLRIATCGTGGGPTLVDVKKNGTSILGAAFSVAHDATDGDTYVKLADTDAKGKLEVGDVLTIETGGTVATNMADLSVEARVAKRFD